MSGAPKPVGPAAVHVTTDADVVIVAVSGLVDERFTGFGSLGTPASVVIDVCGITRMTSFGVRQWLKAMDGLPKQASEQLLLGCPTFFVDQLNMVLNFGGAAKVLTVAAPYTCASCGVEVSEIIDVLAERTNLVNGAIPDKRCGGCGGKLEFDESPESYFAFVNKYGASAIDPRTAAVLASRNLYAAVDGGGEKPPRTIKLVHDAVTYFRIIGKIGAAFRARPFLVGAEGEVVIDLGEVSVFEPAGAPEWRRLIKNLSAQVGAVTLVDVRESILTQMMDSLMIAGNVAVSSVVVQFTCVDCSTSTEAGEMLDGDRFATKTCTLCGGACRADVSETLLRLLGQLHSSPPAASARVIAQRSELLAHAIAEANVQSVDAAASVGSDDTILGKYKIVRRLPADSAIDPFLAKQVGIGGFEKPVVLKKINRSVLDARGRSMAELLDEVKLVGRLAHPNIVQVLDVGAVDDALYLAIEYVNGRTLDDVLAHARGPLPLADALHIAREVAKALDHAHASLDMAGYPLGVVHGDLRPHNVMISADGAVKVLDFGVVMASITARPHVHLAAPEAVAGHPQHASDLYSLGVLIYLMCSGQSPVVKTKKRPPRVRPLEEVVSVPPELAAVVGRLLAHDPAERPGRASEVVAQLSAVPVTSGESPSQSLAALVARLFPDERSDDARRRGTTRDLIAGGPLRPSRPHGEQHPSFSTPMRLDESIAIGPGEGPLADSSEPRSTFWPAALLVILLAAIAFVLLFTLRR